MDPPIHALKFSLDLLKNILTKHNALKNPKQMGFLEDLDMYQREKCPLPVIEAVLGLMEYRKERIQTSFDELCKLKVYNLNDFRFELSLTAIMYFKEGFDHLKFLKYCALLGGLSVRYAKAGHFEIPAGCAQLLGYFLNFWMYSMVFDPQSDYFELACVAQRVRRNLSRKEEVEVKGDKESQKGDEVSDEKRGKAAQTQQPEKPESAQAVHEAKERKDVQEGSEKLPETQRKGEAQPEEIPGKDGMTEKGKVGHKKPKKGKGGKS